MDILKKHNIATQVHYIPIYRQPFYKKYFRFDPKDYPNAEDYYKQALTLPIYPKLSDKEVDKVTNAIRGILT